MSTGMPSRGWSDDGPSVSPEWAAHALTCMAWPSAASWGRDIEAVRDDVLKLAGAIARFEPVRMIVPERDLENLAPRLPSGVHALTLDCDDLWVRDTLPVFVSEAGRLVGVDTAFNVWGHKFRGYDADRRLAGAMLRATGFASRFAGLVTEGGALEFDGAGSLITTRTAILDPNRNPGLTEREATDLLKHAFGVSNVIWLPGDSEEWITNGHVDGIARFAGRPGAVLIETIVDPGHPGHAASAENRRALEHARDAAGRPFETIPLSSPNADRAGEDSNRSYVNYYVSNGAVFVHVFGDKRADAVAAHTIATAFPDRQLVQLSLDDLCTGGGGIHCATMQIPALRSQRV